MNSYKHTAAKEASQKFFYDCAVIGGGASGMIAAITAARKGAKVVLIEHNKKLGTKLLQTGNGNVILQTFTCHHRCIKTKIQNLCKI